MHVNENSGDLVFIYIDSLNLTVKKSKAINIDILLMEKRS